MASTKKSVKFHPRGYCMDDDTVAMLKELAEAYGLKMSSAVRMAIRQAHIQLQKQEFPRSVHP